MSRYGVPFVKGPEVNLPAHPNSCDLSAVKEFASTCTRPMAIDLFSGAGGLSYGLHLAGFDVILAADKEPEAASTHRAHFPGASINVDLSDANVIDSICRALEGVSLDLVAGGPPCQPYSQAAFSKVRHLQTHHGKLRDARRDLWESFLTVVERTKPRAVLIENVPDMAFGRDGLVLRRIIARLESIGYAVDARVLSSEGYGVPQHRQRLFTVAFKDPKPFSWPEGNLKDKRLLWDAINDLPEVEGGDKVESRPYAGTTVATQNYYREGVPEEDKNTIFDQYTRAVRADDLEAFKLMTSKTRYSDLPEHLKRYRDDIFEDKYKRLDWFELCRTITAHISQDGYWYIHPKQHRTLTIREAARVQTFPDHFRFCGFPRHAFKQIGEAVPPLLGKAVASSIYAALHADSDHRPPTTKSISECLTTWHEKEDAEHLAAPWLRADSLWIRWMGHVLFGKAGIKHINKHFQLLSASWPDANSFLMDSSRSERLSAADRASMQPQLTALAEQLVNGASHTTETLAASGFSKASAAVLLAIGGIGDRRPTNASLERISTRFWNRPLTPDDGRGAQELLLGKLLGEDLDGKVFCSAIEVATRFCSPKNQSCFSCPLKELCAFANKAQRDSIQPELEVVTT